MLTSASCILARIPCAAGARSAISRCCCAALTLYRLSVNRGLFNPNLGVSLSLIGDTTSATDPSVKADPSFLASLTAGFRITDARPGQAGQGYFSFWGGPSLALGLGSTIKAGLGAEAGVGVGYRWKWLDASVGGNYFYDPSRPEGLRNIFTLGPTISITFSPEISSGH